MGVTEVHEMWLECSKCDRLVGLWTSFDQPFAEWVRGRWVCRDCGFEDQDERRARMLASGGGDAS